MDLGAQVDVTGIIEGDIFVVANEKCVRTYSLPSFELRNEYTLDVGSNQKVKYYVSCVLVLD